METKQPSIIDLIIETHIGLERQGPGSPEMTRKALSFLEHPGRISRVADLGCGTGGQTMILAQHIPGTIVGVDQLSGFIDVLNTNAKDLRLSERVKGVVGSMEDLSALSFEKEALDLIWSEGAIDGIGFENGLTQWYGFLKKGGYVAVTCPSLFTDECPAQVKSFWADAGSELDTIGNNISVMQRAGYRLVAAFVLPETCWTEQYFAPRQAAERVLLDKYAGNKTVEEFVASSRYEEELFSKHNRHYGYAFYIGKKV